MYPSLTHPLSTTLCREPDQGENILLFGPSRRIHDRGAASLSADTTYSTYSIQ